ncbi:MAG: hypothetical protein WA093_03230 [Minisyncoccales bacterium]
MIKYGQIRTSSQKNKRKIKAWVKDHTKLIVVIDGYAGSDKTTVADLVAKQIGEYINKKTDGKYFDPWLNLHYRLSGKFIGICRKSMRYEIKSLTSQSVIFIASRTSRMVSLGIFCIFPPNPNASKGIFCFPLPRQKPRGFV